MTYSDDPEFHDTLVPLLKERVQERMGAEGDALQLAMRLLTCQIFGLRNDVDRKALLDSQLDDGGWDTCWLCRYGSTGMRLGNRGVTTALAVKAFETWSPSAEVTEAAVDVTEKTSQRVNGGLIVHVDHVLSGLEKTRPLMSF